MKLMELHKKSNQFSGEVYHGSNARFNEFSQDKARIVNDFWGGGVAYFTSDPKIAVQYAKGMSRKEGEPYVYKVDLNLQNYFDVDDKFSGEDLVRLLPKDLESFARGAGLLKLGVDKYKVLTDLQKGNITLSGADVFKGLSNGGKNTDAARKYLISKGYDGFRYNGGEHMDMARHDVFMPYNSKSISNIKRFKVRKKQT